MPNDKYAERLKEFDAGLSADQAECQAMLDGLGTIEAGLQDEKISGAIDDMLLERGNDWPERQALLESLNEPVAAEIDRRVELMGASYPFQVKKGALSYVRSKTGVYEYCLAAARNPTGASEGQPHASTIFEWIARDVLILHLGNGAKGLRTGWPIHDSERRGHRTKETLQLLHKQSGEFRWEPDYLHPNDPEPKDLKDIGLDIVAWKPWPDGRLGQLFAIGQCACGKNDLPKKGYELSLARLENWLRPVCHARPIRCFLLAHHIPNLVQLAELSKEAGLIFDRARLAMLAESSPKAVQPIDGVDYHQMAKLYANAKAA